MPMNVTLLKGIFNSVSYAAERIPDHWWDIIPYYRTPKDQKKSKKRDKRARRHSEGHSDRHRDYDHDEDNYVYESDDQRKARRDRFDNYEEEGFPRARSQGRARATSVRATRGGNTDDYYSSRAHEMGGDGTRYVAPVVAGAAAAHYMDSRRPVSSSSSSGPVAGGYVPYADIYGTDADHQQPRQSNLRRDSSRHPAVDTHYRAPHVSDYRSTSDSLRSAERGASRARYHHRDGHRDRDDDRHRDERRHRDDRHHRDGEGGRRRSKSRGGFDLSATTLGAVAGGLAGNGAGRGRILPTVAGAVVGGLGGNAYERDSKRKQEERDRRRSSRRDRHDYETE